jgi:hypothetical protein
LPSYQCEIFRNFWVKRDPVDEQGTLNMKNVMTILALFALCATCHAQSSVAYEDAMSVLASEEIECGAFWNVVGVCFETASGDKSTSRRALAARDTMFERATKATADAKLLLATIDARQEHFQNSMIVKVGKDCRNVEILLGDHGDRCKRLMESPADRVSELMKRGGSVPK